MRNRGFTLVELLVVVAIIALLLAILLPSLGKARAVVRSVVCGKNQKSIGSAWVIFANDNNGHGPGHCDNIASQNSHSPLRWMEILNSQVLGNREDMVPWVTANRPIQRFFTTGSEVRLDNGALGCPDIGKYPVGLYGRPYIANIMTVGGDGTMASGFEYGPSAPNPGILYPDSRNNGLRYYLGTKLDAIKRPAYTYMIWESGRGNDEDKYRGHIDPTVVPDGQVYSNPSGSNHHYFGFRHPGLTLNALMADGHVQRMNPDKPDLYIPERFNIE